MWTTPSGILVNNTNQLYPDGQKTVLSNHSLLITNISAWDMGNYTCIAINEVGKQSALPAEVNVRSKYILFLLLICLLIEDTIHFTIELIIRQPDYYSNVVFLNTAF